MLCINHTSNNPYFNIASEEHLLRNYSEDILMLYVNEPSVIIGKHQNTFAEINYRLAKEKDVKIVRRLSGGGAVYHDLGNLNFTFIKNSQEGKLVDFRGYTKPIIELLKELGVDAHFEGHNSLNIKGKKFSGNAEHIYKNRVMHHGTLLFSTNMQMLAELLYNNTDRYTDRAVKSVRANTTNLSEHLSPDFTLEKFKEYVISHIAKTHKGFTIHSLSRRDIEAIHELMEMKYTTWAWNFGYSPSYSFTRDIKAKGNIISITMEVQKGLISSVSITGNSLNSYERETIESSLLGCKHNEDEVKKHLNGIVVPSEMQQKIYEALF